MKKRASESVFENLDEAGLRGLVPRGLVRTFPKHAVIVNEHDTTDSFYIVLGGRVKAYVHGEDGKEVIVNVIGPGEYFGELVLDGGTRSASIMTLEPCRCFVIPRSEIDILLERYPQFAMDMIEKLIGKVRSLTDKVRDLALRDVYGRFVRFIEDNAIEHDDKVLVPERLTQQEIAERIGGSREMVSRIIRDLSVGGYISVEAKKINLHKKLPTHW